MQEKSPFHQPSPIRRGTTINPFLILTCKINGLSTQWKAFSLGCRRSFSRDLPARDEPYSKRGSTSNLDDQFPETRLPPGPEPERNFLQNQDIWRENPHISVSYNEVINAFPELISHDSPPTYPLGSSLPGSLPLPPPSPRRRQPFEP